ncbi:hypothetical protein A2774_00305 [Candidatus Roizmanbacteria bacterium RIFCSPHIGHO2_01_FULL_39_12c]|uniref:Glycosyltransferase RgtA/B/C/D-like domain-containing protein n=1 Tax=Candidatus Roizmanbacteria bacterium RIFCSPHIGHO2_01_FULL_39_12c TaxID=1802031 RepID=A0A1F7GDJ6_9BACT|nr:MAG: hypothetical protein A2774_00305 [Candidatus Roizmanbacteria bacterium RIFCSPHIGHO2_01_FULL_39_12c]
MFLFFYVCLSLVLILLVTRSKVEFSFAAIFTLALALRTIVLLVFLTSRSEDINSFIQVGQMVLDKEAEYGSFYFPFISYLSALVLKLKNYIHPIFSLKLIFIFFDSLVTYPIYLLSGKNKTSALIYALNPASVIVTVIHGQMDSIPLFFFLLALAFFVKNKLSASILTLSLAIFTKPWPILFILPLFKRAKNKLLFIFLPLFPLAFTVIYSIFYRVEIKEMLNMIKGYRGVFGAWGISKIALYLTDYNLSPAIEQLLRRVFLIGFIVFSYLRSDKKVIVTIVLSMLFLFVFSPTFGMQWFSWIVPLVIIVRPKLWKIFLVMVSVYLASGFAWDAYRYVKEMMTFWNSVINRIGFLFWIFIIIMFYRNVFYQTTQGNKNRR